MPSSLILSINNIPQMFSETDIYDAVVKKDICKVASIIIKTGKVKNSAIIVVDYWYKGTRHIRDTLVSGYPVSIMVGSTIWLAYEYKNKDNEKYAKVYPETDEFGRDVLRIPNNTTVLRADAPVFVPKSLQHNNDIDEENKRAADDFIAQLVYELNKLVSQQNNSEGANAPPGSHQHQSHKYGYDDNKEVEDMEDGELCETIVNNDNNKCHNMSKMTLNTYTEAALKRKIRFALPSKK